MTAFFRIWKFGPDDQPLHSEYTAFKDGDAAIAAARKCFRSLVGVEIWDGCCRVWPRPAIPESTSAESSKIEERERQQEQGSDSLVI